MGLVVVCEKVGGPEVLKAVQQPEPELHASEVLIEQKAIGVNFLDTLIRSGKRSLLQFPAVLGLEASGIIRKLGSEVKGFEVGQRVAYCTAPIGAYCQYRAIDSEYLVDVPDALDDKVVASSFLKGMTAHYLATRAYLVQSGKGVLIHSAASGVGQFLASWCNAAGAFIIGTVGDDSKKQVALDAGCHKVYNYKSEDWVQGVLDETKGIGLNVVYDSLGAAVFNNSFKCLMPMGIMVAYGQSSGPVGPVDLSLLREKSLFLTVPTIYHYKKYRMELVLTTHEVFAKLLNGGFRPNIAEEFQLHEAAKAHTLMESGKTSGSIILVP